jgi:hypothetical protein
MTLGRQGMAETERVEQTRTGEKQRGQKLILRSDENGTVA